MSCNPFLLLFSALACHLCCNKYEPTGFPSLTFLLVIWPGALAFLPKDEPTSVFTSLFLTYSIYYSSLLISIGTYRLSPTHSLSKYPGPLVCKISKLWLMYIASTGSLHLYIKRLHDKYGPVVRIGPNELSIVDESLIPSILGVKGMPKGPMWDGRLAGKAQSGSEAAPGILIGSRNSQGHAKARKSWNTAFTPAAIKGYEPMLIRRVSQLVDSLDQRKSKLDLSHWFSYFSFDFMGDIAFGGGFELMRDTNQRFLWHTMERGMRPPSLIHQVPWCIELIRFLPMVGRDMKSLAKFAAEQSTRRLQEGSVHDDIFYYLMESKRLNAEPYPFPLTVSNAVTIIVAGADTTASVLTNTFFYLLSNPKVYRRLQAEVDDTFPRDHGSREPNDAALLTNMPYLNSVIKETLRLQPPVPTSLQRAPQVGTGSQVIGNGFIIPEGTAVQVPPYTIHRDSRYFSPNPDSFMPERWLAEDDDPNFVLNNNAYIPFSTGPANCIGKNIALLELRVVVAYLMRTFEMSFAEGYDARRWEADLKDHFTLGKGSLPVYLVSRV